jgi:2-(1,2-epoxy-1,2-dihydrophenyl)acetyl-CoA isomerase
MSVVETRDEGPIRIITLNRPYVRNAIDIPLRVELAQALEAADADDEVRAIVLTGAGNAFCSGGDISTMQRMAPDDAAARAQLAQRVIRGIWNTPKPVIAAVEGAAFGAGAALAFACDRVVASREAHFAVTFTKVGLAGDMGIFASLPRRAGIARARQMLLMPEPITGEQAAEWGLVDALSAPGVALDAATADAAALAAGPGQALGVIKSMLQAAPSLHPLDVLDEEAHHQSELFGTDDFAEGVAAFHGKRRPAFGRRQGVHP